MIRISPAFSAPTPSAPGAAPGSVDPFDVTPTAFTREAIAHLRHAVGLDPSPNSPLTSFVKGLSGASPLGPLPSGLPPAHTEEAFLKALHLLEKPQARLRVALARPEGASLGGAHSVRLAHIYVSGSWAVRCEENADRVWIGPRFPAMDLVDTLRELLSSRPPVESRLESPAVALWPIIADLAKTLWPNGQGHPIRRRHALLRLDQMVQDPALARRLLGALGESGVLTESDGRIALSSLYRPWLEALFSGDRVEIERLDLMNAEEPAAPDCALFVGQPGRRVLCTEISQQSLQDLAVPGIAGPAGMSEDCLLLTYLPDPALETRLIELVTMEATRDPAL